MSSGNTITAFVILVLGVAISIWLGMGIATDQVTTLAIMGGSGLLLAAAMTGRRIWLFAIFLASLDVPIIRGFSTGELGRMLLVGFGAAMFLMHRLNFRVTFGELEVWLLLIVLSVVQVYMRNPVGLNIFGAGNVGGKPYFFMALVVVSSLILSTLMIPAREMKWIMWVGLLGNAIGEPLGIIRGSAGIINEETGRMAGRVGVFRDLGGILARWFVSFHSPLKSILHPGWAFFMLFTVALAAASGYRNAIASLGLTYCIAICYYSGFRGLMLSVFFGGFALGSLALFNLAAPLPMHIQRALSPLPGSWDERIMEDTSASTDWRWEMWEEALSNDRWIENKILGDGLGITKRELERNQDMDATTDTAFSGTDLSNQQINMLTTGSFHSGPLHSIRTVGYVGLGILLLAMIRVAIHFHRQITRCWGTEWQPLALFVGIPMIISPIFFVFVFGEYHTGVASVASGVAMIRLFERNIPLPAYRVAKRGEYVPLAFQARRKTTGASRSA